MTRASAIFVAGVAASLWLAFLAGCGPRHAERPRQGEALAIAWRGFLREPRRSPPDVSWVEGERCPYGMTPPAIVLGGLCAAGLDWAEEGLVVLVWEGSFHASAFAHELAHQHLFWSTGDPDASHAGPTWLTVVPAANAALAAAGL